MRYIAERKMQKKDNLQYMKLTTTICLLLIWNALVITPLPAAEADQATQAIIKKLRLEEAPEPVSRSPVWKKPEKILITIPVQIQGRQQELLESLEEIVGDIEIVPLVLGFREEPDAALLKDAEVFLGYCTPNIIKTAKKLRWLQHYGTGVDHCVLTPEIKDSNFILTNAQHTAGPPIAEHVIAMMMMLTRNLHHFHTAQLNGKWERPTAVTSPIIEVGGKTMLVVGLGGIGTEVAKRASALGMRVIATRHSSREGPDYVDYVGLSDELLTLAKQADVIVNALPLTKETMRIFNKKFFHVLKPGSYFISIGRGKSTVTDDLIAALKDGSLAGAGLDVTDPEPLPPGHELWTLPNVIITPHISWMTDKGFERNWLVIRENLRRYINGEKLLNVVDIKRGY